MKKITRLIPILVLAIVCIFATGVLTACEFEPAHKHSFTEWNHNDTEHWKECPEDHTIDESTRAAHEYVVGECECGATEPVAPTKYGKATGTIKLHKQGTYVTDYTGINIDLSDDGAELDFDTATGTFTFDNVKVGETHTLTVTKSGYRDYVISAVQVEENQTATLGGEAGIVLEYDVFGYLENYDPEYHDLSKVNEENPYIIFKAHEGTKTLNVLTKDSYESVSASMRINWNNSTNNMHTQGIVLKFEDGNHAIVRYHNGDMENGNIQYANNLWNQKADTSIFDANELNQWGEKAVHTLLSSETEAIKNGEGLDLTVVVSGGKLYTYFAGNWVATYAIPEETVGKKVQVAYFAFDAANDAIFYYEISETIPTTTSAVNVTVNKPEDEAAASANVTSDKESYEMGDEITLTVTKALGYKLDTLTVNGVDMTADVVNNTLTLTANRTEMNVEATFVKEEPIAIAITLKGKKLGTTANLVEGTKVTFKNTEYAFTVNAEGKITNESVVKGKYTVVSEGYFEKEIVLDENLQEIVLEYDAFKEILGWGSFDFTKQNEETPEFGITNDCSVILTKDTYGDVKSSIYLKGNNMNVGNGGLVFRFVGEGFAQNGETVTITMQGTKKVQFSQDNLWGQTTVADGCVWKNLYYFENCYDDNADHIAGANAATYLEEYAQGNLKLSVIRKGATFYVFLDDAFIGQLTVNEKYASAKCEVGFLTAQLGNTSDWKSWKVEISENATLSDVTITNATAENANGTIEISENVKIGDTVTVTVKPAQGYMLDKITVSGGVVPAAGSNNTFTFVATEKAYTVTATFIEAPAVEAETTVSGIDLGAAQIDMNGKEISFKPQEGAETKLTVTEGKVKGILAAGEYTVSCEGFYDLTATVEADGSFAEGTSLAFEKIIFAYNLINEPESNMGDKPNVGSSKTAASEGVIKATADGRIYEWTTEQYKDVAITVTLKSGNGNQGIIMRFNGEQKDVRLRFENNKAQWMGNAWFWGTICINDRWDFGGGNDYANPMNDTLLAKYNGEGLTLTLVRKGGMTYALIDGTLYAGQSVSNYATSDARIAVFAEDAKNGYSIPFAIEDADTALAKAGVAVGTDMIAYGGTWTEDGATLKVAGGRGYAEFIKGENVVTESAKINISKANGGDQGIMYRFADGKYIAVRYQENDGNYKVQYTMDTVFFNDGSLKNWTDFMMTEEEKTAFDANGLDLTFIRNGAKFYVVLGNRILDKSTLEDKYATMEGVMGVMIWNGSNSAFAYEYKTAENVTIPEYYTVNASFDGNAFDYAITLDKNLVAKDGKVTLTVYSDPNTLGWASWSRFPAKISVNGVETALTVADFVSDGANKLHYTTELTISEDTEIKVTIAQGTVIEKGVVVTVKDNVGGTAKSDSGENGYYWNDACTLYITPAEGYEIASITIDGGEAITSGWTFDSAKNCYKYDVEQPIQKPTTIVVEFKAVTTAE